MNFYISIGMILVLTAMLAYNFIIIVRLRAFMRDTVTAYRKLYSEWTDLGQTCLDKMHNLDKAVSDTPKILTSLENHVKALGDRISVMNNIMEAVSTGRPVAVRDYKRKCAKA